MTEAVGVTGAYLVEGCTLPDTASALVADMLPYFDSGNRACPGVPVAGEGPDSGSILVEVASGITSGEQGARVRRRRREAGAAAGHPRLVTTLGVRTH